ncbi:unnamed protein product [Rotaria sp. Silwood1]|nr:unnamed protein product [Rotaria sp. Silwood1]
MLQKLDLAGNQVGDEGTRYLADALKDNKLFDTLTESLIYGITGLFPTGSFTQVVQVGSGMTGFLNVSVNTIIRLIILLFHSKIDADQLSLYIYMSVLIILAGLAIFMFAYRLIDIPSVTIRMNQQMV